MKISTIISLCFFLCLCHVTQGIASEQLKNKIIKEKLSDNINKTMNNDPLFLEDLFRVIETAGEFKLRDFKQNRLLYTTALLILDFLNEKYGTNEQTYLNVLNGREKNIYKKALKINTISNYKEYYSCYDDESKRKRSMDKIKSIRSETSKIIRDDRSKSSSDEVLMKYLEILEECKYGYINYSLLDVYRDRGDVESYNKIFIDVLRMDQIEYDFMYDGNLLIESGFISEYIRFLCEINSSKSFDYISKNDVVLISEYVMSKHSDVFEISSWYYYDQERDVYNKYSVRNAIQALINISTWLKYYGLYDADKKLKEKYFTQGPILEELLTLGAMNDFVESLEIDKNSVDVVP